VTQAKTAANAVTVLATDASEAHGRRRTSVAILPFVDMSEKKDQEYFSDGLSEELIELLGKTPGCGSSRGLRPSTSKGRAEKLEAIAAELRVGERTRRQCPQVRQTNCESRHSSFVWIPASTFGPRRSIANSLISFKVQDEIAGAVVTALRVHLLPTQKAAGQDELRTENLEAYNLYLQGKQSYNEAARRLSNAAVTRFPGRDCAGFSLRPWRTRTWRWPNSG